MSGYAEERLDRATGHRAATSREATTDGGEAPAGADAGAAAGRGPAASEGSESRDGRGEREGATDGGSPLAPCDAHPSGLSARDRAVLGMARRTWHRPGAKERAIREELGMSPTRYYQLLNALLDTAEALAYDPVTVNRLRRVRDARRSRR